MSAACTGMFAAANKEFGGREPAKAAICAHHVTFGHEPRVAIARRSSFSDALPISRIGCSVVFGGERGSGAQLA